MEMPEQGMGLQQSIAELIAPELSLQGFGWHSAPARSCHSWAWVSQLVMPTQGGLTMKQGVESCQSRL